MKNYRITIKSTVDGETNEIMMFGDVSREYGCTTVSYLDEESNDPTKIVIGNGLVSISRSGEMNTLLTFEKDKIYTANINTEYGEIPMEIQTLGLTASEFTGGVDLKLSYITDIAGYTSRFNLSLHAEKLN